MLNPELRPRAALVEVPAIRETSALTFHKFLTSLIISRMLSTGGDCSSLLKTCDDWLKRIPVGIVGTFTRLFMHSSFSKYLLSM